MTTVDDHYPLDPRARTMTSAQLAAQLASCRGRERLRWMLDRDTAQLIYESHPDTIAAQKSAANEQEQLERRYP